MINRSEIINSLSDFMKKNNKKYNIVKIGLFGSIARDNINEKSDVDIVVELTKPDFINLISIKQELEKQFHCRVDVVRYWDTYLKHRIDSEAV